MSQAWKGGSSSAWRKLRAARLVMDSYRCQIKGPKCKGMATTVDHIIPVGRGGSMLPDITGLRAACTACNMGRRDKPSDYEPKRMTEW